MYEAITNGAEKSCTKTILYNTFKVDKLTKEQIIDLKRLFFFFFESIVSTIWVGPMTIVMSDGNAIVYVHMCVWMVGEAGVCAGTSDASLSCVHAMLYWQLSDSDVGLPSLLLSSVDIHTSTPFPLIKVWRWSGSEAGLECGFLWFTCTCFTNIKDTSIKCANKKNPFCPSII